MFKPTTYTPQILLTHAEALGLPSNFAIDFYTRFVQKKGVEDLVLGLARKLKLSPEKARQKVNAYRRFWKESLSNEPGPLNPVNKGKLLEEALANLEEVIGEIPKIKKLGKLDGPTIKCIVASDFHIPFENTEALAHLMNETADVLFIAGDFFDMYAVSSHRKTIDHLLVREELSRAIAILKMLSEKFSKVYLISGNHDVRVSRKIQNFMPEILPLIVDPLELISNRFKNVELLTVTAFSTAPNTRLGSDLEVTNLGSVGNMVLAHLDGFCGKDAAEMALRWVDTFLPLLDIPESPKALFHGHSHRMNLAYTPEGRLIVNTGCMCKPMPYIFENAGKYPAPTCGYVLFNTDDQFNINIDSVRIRFIGN